MRDMAQDVVSVKGWIAKGIRLVPYSNRSTFP